MVKALICGGGNGAHVMAGIAAAQPDTEARVITLYADEAERWTANMTEGFSVIVHDGDKQSTLNAKPALVTKSPEQAMPGIQIILFAVPAFAHEQYLNALKPFVQPGTILVGIPGQAGFEFAVRGIWGDLAKQCTIMSFESLPWACRIKDFGKSAEVLGTKGSLLGAVQLGNPPPPADPTAMVQSVLGEFPKLVTTGHLLGITLMGTNGYLHPSIMYGRWKDWDGKALDENPLFYNGLDEFSAGILSGASDEVVAIAKSLMQQRSQVDLSNVSHIYQWYLRCYDKDIKDKTNLYTCIQTNAAYKGLTHPTEKTPEGKFVPNFKYRYLLEDIPFGLVVMKGVAALAGVPTPTMDKIIEWAQKVMGKEYIVNGQPTGKDMASTRSPQKYGLTSIDTVLGLQ